MFFSDHCKISLILNLNKNGTLATYREFFLNLGADHSEFDEQIKSGGNAALMV